MDVRRDLQADIIIAICFNQFILTLSDIHQITKAANRNNCFESHSNFYSHIEV